MVMGSPSHPGWTGLLSCWCCSHTVSVTLGCDVDMCLETVLSSGPVFTLESLSKQAEVGQAGSALLSLLLKAAVVFGSLHPLFLVLSHVPVGVAGRVGR